MLESHYVVSRRVPKDIHIPLFPKVDTVPFVEETCASVDKDLDSRYSEFIWGSPYMFLAREVVKTRKKRASAERAASGMISSDKGGRVISREIQDLRKTKKISSLFSRRFCQ